MYQQVFTSSFKPSHLEERKNEAGEIIGRNWVEDPAIQVRVELQIDIEAIVRILANKACKSKRGKSIAMGGLIKVKKL